MFHGSELGAVTAQACAVGGIAFSQACRLGGGECAFPAAYAAGWTEIAAPQLRGESTCLTDRKHGFIDVGNRRLRMGSYRCPVALNLC